MKQYILVLIGVLVIAGGGLWWAFSDSTNAPTANTEGTVRVATSFYVLEEIVREVGGDEVTLSLSAPAGVDAHTYEPTARDVKALYESDLFLYMGQGLDTWAEDVSAEAMESGVEVLEVTAHVDLLPTAGEADEHSEEEHGHDEDGDEHAHEDEDAHDHDEEEEHGHEDEHDHGEFDPHVWLDPSRVVDIVSEVQELLATVDPDNADAYEARATAYIERLNELDEEFADGLAACEHDTIIAAHDAFAYMGERYGFKIEAIAGLSPEAEPSAQRMAALSDLAQDTGLEYIFFESLTSPRLSETIADEVGAETLVLNPIEGLTQEDIDAGENYFTIMRANLENLSTALECTTS